MTLLALMACLLMACVTIAPAPTATPLGPPPVTSRPTASLNPTPTRPSAPATPRATPRDGPPSPDGSLGPGATLDPELAAEIEDVIGDVPAIRELEALTDVPYEFMTREEFQDQLVELQFSEVPEATRQAEERLLKRLGLLAEDADLDQLLVDLYGGQVAAFYRPDTKRFYIIERNQPFGATDKIIVAHEYTHALQDQHFDLETTRVKDLSEGDAALAQLAAVEGDATLTMQLWTAEPGNLTPEEAFQVLLESFGQLQDPTLANMPPILRRQLEFPYAEGFAFIQSLHAIGGFDAVNATLSDAIPASTEQILHSEKYTANEMPVDVQAPDRVSQLGSGWVVSYEQTMGELIMQVWAAGGESPAVNVPGIPAEWPNADSVAGWAGDRLVMYEHPDGRWAIEWQTAWDSELDANEFSQRASEVGDLLGGPFEIGRFGQRPPAQPTDMSIRVASDGPTLALFGE
jgi:hypothetical protein